MGVYPYLQCVTLQVVTGRPQDPIIVVVVVECYCFLIKIIVVGVEPRRDALVYAPCVFCLKISIGLAKRLYGQSVFVVVVRRFL